MRYEHNLILLPLLHFFMAMKHLLLVICFALSAATHGQPSKMSLSAIQAASQYKNNNKTQRASTRSAANAYAADSAATSADIERITLFVHASGNFDENTFNNLDAIVVAKADSLYTISLPIENMEALANLNGIKFIDGGRKARKLLDISAADIGAVQAWNGSEQMPPYTGKNVVVGIIDWGFDLTHPTLYKDGEFRVKRLWIQDATPAMPPAGFTVGREYISPSAIIALQTTNRNHTHGSHTAGIAAGSGGTMGRYIGIAPDADIVLVEVSANGTDADFIKGIRYIFDYAQSVSKPAVVNISFGHHMGPHNGNSSFDKQLDALTGAGRIVVGAAGNEGNNNIHAKHNFSATATRRIAITPQEGEGGIAAIATPAADFEWWIEVWNKTNATRLYCYPNPLKSSDNAYLCGDNTCATDHNISVSGSSVGVKAVSYSARNANLPAFMEAQFVSHNANLAVVFAFKANSGALHVWNARGNSLFVPDGAGAGDGWLAPDNDYSIGELGGTARSIITAGAYIASDFCDEHKFGQHKCSQQGAYYALSAANQTAAAFSSHGPTIDGRIKPDVLAPGQYVVSSINSHCTGNADCVPCIAPAFVASFNIESDGEHCYATMSGTSMAAPMVTGVAALMLEANPLLTPDTLAGLLRKYADVDAGIKSAGAAVRGYGKVRAHDALLNKDDREGLPLAVGFMVDDAAGGAAFSIVPNPNRGVFELRFGGEHAQAAVYSISGVLLWSREVERHDLIELPHFPAGVYVVVLKVDGALRGGKMVIVR
jgi:subtilisin family serine protease